MIYGNKFLNLANNKSVATAFESTSVAYTEYTNRLSLLESCTNEEERSILEAQVQVLCEVSIKDIFGKIKEAWNKFKAFLRGIFEKLFGKKKEVDVRAAAAEKVADKAIQKIEQQKKDESITEDIWNKIKLIYISVSLDGKTEVNDEVLESKHKTSFSDILNACKEARNFVSNRLKLYVSGSMQVAMNSTPENFTSKMQEYNDNFSEGLTGLKKGVDGLATLTIDYKFKVFDDANIRKIDKLSDLARSYKNRVKAQKDVIDEFLKGLDTCKNESESTVKEVDSCIEHINSYINGIRNTKGTGDNNANQKSLNAALVKCSNAIDNTRSSLYKLSQKFGVEFTKAENAKASITKAYMTIEAMSE